MREKMHETKKSLDRLNEGQYIQSNVNGEQLRIMRREYGLRQEDLGAMLDVPQETISRWETGTYNMTRRDSIAVVTVLNSYKRKQASKPA